MTISITHKSTLLQYKSKQLQENTFWVQTVCNLSYTQFGPENLDPQILWHQFLTMKQILQLQVKAWPVVKFAS